MTGRAAEEREGSLHSRALAALGMASSLDPHDTASRHRLGTVLRRDKRRLKEAMHQFQVVLRVNLKPESAEFRQVKQALDEVVEQHRELVNPQRNWRTAAYQLVSLAVLVGMLLHFTRHDMKSD